MEVVCTALATICTRAVLRDVVHVVYRRCLRDFFRKKRGAGGSDEVDAPLPVAKKSKEVKKEESQLKVCSTW